MVFRSINRYSKPGYKLECTQRCSCANLNHLEKNGKCINKVDVIEGGKLSVSILANF